MFARYLIGLLAVGLLLAGCGTGGGGGPAVSQQNLGGTPFVALGNGRFVAAKGLSDSNADVGYRIRAFIRANGSLTLVSHSDESLSTGVAFTFVRRGNTIEVTVGGRFITTFGPKAVDEAIEIKIDAHNSHAHYMVADSLGAALPNLFNSEESPIQGLKGRGDKWGVILTDVEPLSITTGAPGFAD